MAFRKKIHPKVDRWEKRQTRAARFTGLGLVLIMVGGVVALANWITPPQHLPWTPLTLAQPVGLATAVKVAATPAGPDCRAILTKGGVTFQDIPDKTDGFCVIHDALTLTGGLSALHPIGAVMTCREALAFSVWEKQVVQPAASAMLGSPVATITHFGAYSCRRRYGRADQPVSEHALANAIDVGAFTLANGQTVTVEKDWSDPGPKGQFLHQIRQGACGVFETVLSPDYNAEHHNHLHLDMGNGPVCH